MKYRFDGKEKLFAIGVYPAVSLLQARAARDDAKKLIAQGIDPVKAKSDEKNKRKISENETFTSVAISWWEKWKETKTERYSSYVLRRLENDVFGVIGNLKTGNLSARDFVYVAKSIEKRGSLEVARRVLETCGQIMRYAVVNGLSERNPLSDIKPSDILDKKIVKNFSRVDENELPNLLIKINGYDGSIKTRFALKLLCLTFVRTSELINAKWKEFDMDGAIWKIPSDRVGRKGRLGERKPHIVPLSKQSILILKSLKSCFSGGDDDFLFFGDRDKNKAMSNNTLLKALDRMGYKGKQTGHGFRGIASTALNEMGFSSDVIEAQLSHVSQDRVRAAYNHATYIVDRTSMMQVWADYITAVELHGKPINFASFAKMAQN